MNKEQLVIFGSHDLATIDQIHRVIEHSKSPDFAVLCSDAHVGYSVPIGAVIAYENQICVNGIGYDIACGNKAVRVSRDSTSVRKDIYRTMNDVQKYISFGVGRKNKEVIRHELFDDPIWDEIDLLKGLKSKAIAQLGTVGSGNHYVDIFVDDLDQIWIGVHFGSRGLGHSIATHFVKSSGGKDGIHAEPVVLDVDSDLGEQYIRCMELAGKYAYAGRDWVCSKVSQILGTQILEEVHCHHNFAWKENHFGQDLWVVRKGATPNRPGEKSFVGGSMGDFSYILQGIDSQENTRALRSTIHGAGRVLGRVQARGKTCRKTGKILKPGCVTKDSMDVWLKEFDVELRGGGLDESPHCYRRINEVLHAHRESVCVVRRLKPIGVCMASANEFDPYKD